ncbi:carbonic anhydrase 2-like [Actinia tenebrosa]|uniref:Carbonic anhydrase n=1 Tax=Actinia tenebrosa TaxID=6105 RepID=A0A6P8IYA4_ACTTE|nr:carbonic anhydrase 2-like [Actinia tenebrosa]XP_031572155.1 carbonic anhydrase 2-like [Actinia tenebrosa]
MNSTWITLVLTGLLGTAYATGGASWGYGKTNKQAYGPRDWGEVSQYCNGRSQSPINIIRRKAVRKNLRPLIVEFENEQGEVTGTFSNNGHSPTFTVDKAQGGASVVNPIDEQKFILDQFHFHFGCADYSGSEHTVNGRAYAAEMHMVFYNSKYDNAGDAATKPDGLLVIGTFLRKSKTASKELTKLAHSLPNIKTEGSEVNGIQVKLDSLFRGLSSGNRSYYTYKGSLTTPGCYESVRWVVLKTPISIDKRVLKNFRLLQATHGYHHGKLCNNYRPTLPLNGRKVQLKG